MIGSLGDSSRRRQIRTVRLTPAADLKLELTVKDQDSKGKIVLEIGWKRRPLFELPQPERRDRQ